MITQSYLMRRYALLMMLMGTGLQLYAAGVDRQTLHIVNQSLDYAVLQSMKMYEVMEPKEGLLPRSADKGKLITCKPNWWTSGFYPGLLWYLYEYTNRQDIRSAAEKMTDRLAKEQFQTNDHDVGFVINCSYGNGYRLTQNPAYHQALINAGHSLATRFDSVVGCTRSWNTRNWGFAVIIDNMMNLELLTVASALSADRSFYDMAKSHADRTLENHFRPDGSSYHLIGYDSITGKANHKITRQGYSDASAWARGQAWALYGYTMMYRQTGDQRYLNHAVKIGRFLMNHSRLPKDKIPYWDYDVPTIPDAPRDASAGALMASAYIELSRMIDGELSARFLKLAEQQITSLSSSNYRAKLGSNNCFLLKHSTGYFAKNYEVDEPLSYADYYYVEALMRYKRLAEGRAVVDVCTVYSPQADQTDRSAWLGAMTRIVRPVLTAMSRHRLRETMVVESSDKIERRKECTYLEALGRTITGIAPWLELGPDSTIEGRLRGEYISLAVQSIRNGVDPSSPDYLNFSQGRQPLVDAAFLAHGLLRAPGQLWGNLDETTRRRLLEELRSTRQIQPGQNNWMLFTALVEAALCEFGDTGYDERRMLTAVQAFQEWYSGDGWYGDGPSFHLDYYNSYVIHPMLMQVLDVMRKHHISGADWQKVEAQRYARYAYQQERLISPEGTFPLLGRSSAYRFGAFHALSDAAYRQILPKEVKPAQVRSALTQVIRRQMEPTGTFTPDGWLRIGFCGYQPSVGESYISTGSLYLCTAAFVALGLPPENEFWSGDAVPWTQQSVWSGKDIKADKALKQ